MQQHLKVRREALVAPEQPQQTEPHASLARERAPAHLVLPLRLLVLRQLVQLKVAHDARDGIEDLPAVKRWASVSGYEAEVAGGFRSRHGRQ